MSFSSNFGSLESLNVLTRCGLRPRADQMRCTVAGLTPCALAIERQLQCVSPGRVSSRLARTISATFSTEIDALRPPSPPHHPPLAQSPLAEAVPPGPHRSRRDADPFG